MILSNYDKKELKLKCADLLARTYLELGQKMQSATIVMSSGILCDDLQRDFGNLTLEDIQIAFRDGVRRSEEFHLNVKTMYKWIFRYRKLLWDAQYQVHTMNKDPKQVPYYRPKNKLITTKTQIK